MLIGDLEAADPRRVLQTSPVTDFIIIFPVPQISTKNRASATDWVSGQVSI